MPPKNKWLRDLGRVAKGVLLFLPLAVLVAAVNGTIDPASLFQRGYERRAAEIIASGQNASQLKNMDDRTFQRDCAELLPYTPDTLVLGSSRCMQLTARGLECETLFNAGVTNGDLRDMISLYELYKELGKTPRRVILMTDYCMFNPAKLDARAYTDGYAAFAARTGTAERKTRRSSEKWKQLFSPTYFQSAIAYWAAGGGSESAVPTLEYETDGDMRRADGSYSYGLGFRGMTDEEKRQAAVSTSAHIAYNMGAYSEDDPVLRQQFELFVDEMQADGVEVVFQLPPINPAMYRAMQQDENYARQLALEEYFRAFAQEKGIGVFGSYDAVSLGLTELDFYDALHCSLEATNRYIPDWLKSSG